MLRFLYAKPLQATAVLVAGPIGCSLLYYVVFILRPFDPTRYAGLANRLDTWGIFIEVFAALAVLGLAVVVLTKVDFASFEKRNRSIPAVAMVAMTLITAALMALTFYRVFGTLDPETIIGKYAFYYSQTRIGGAWVIWIGYGILYVFLADMFFGGVNRTNSALLLACIFMNSVTGGRTLPLLMILAFLFLLYFQRPRLLTMLAAVFASVAIGFSGYLTTSALREGAPEIEVPAIETNEEVAEIDDVPADDPTNNWQSLNYDAAFILDDVISGLGDGSVTPQPHGLYNFNLFVPRFIYPDKLRSDSETRTIYPEVGARGTTISFPLKANLMINLGAWAFHFNWLVVALAQVGLIWSIAKRQTKPTLLSFAAFYIGCTYFLVERAGLFNPRLLIHLFELLAAYACYRIATAGWFLGILSALKLSGTSRRAHPY